MKKTSRKKDYTQEQLIRKLRRIRKLGSFAKVMGKKKSIVGKELFLDTVEGKVRVLAYNMEKSERLPLFINIHGSGFTLGSAEMDDPFMLNIAENANVKILSIDYSLAPECPFPKALNECYAVVKYAKEHPDEFGIDPDNIAVGGHSAGGNFSAAICLLDNDRKELGIKCLILDYPLMDVYTDASLKPHPIGSIPVFMSRLFDVCYCIDKEERKNPLISPLFATIGQLKSFPPTLVITARKDFLCEEGEKFKDKLLEAGVDVTHKRFNAFHGFNLMPGKKADESWRMMIEHLRRCLWGG